jgi:drug/metabolite transporter (DMT)-like permease
MIYLIIVSLIWAFSFGLIGNTLAGIPPAWQGMVRLGIAAIVFLPFVRRVEFRLGVKLFFIGMIQFGLMYLFYITAFRHLRSHEVALFTALTPVYVVMLSNIFHRSFSPASWIAAALAAIGSAILLWKHSLGMEAMKGFWLVQASNVCFAAGQLLYRYVMASAKSVADDIRMFFWLYLGAVAALVPFAVGNMPVVVQPAQWVALVYLGAIASGASFFLWNVGARQTGAGMLAVMNNLKIPLAAVVSLTVFGEAIRWTVMLAGMLLFILACLLPRLSAFFFHDSRRQ